MSVNSSVRPERRHSGAPMLEASCAICVLIDCGVTLSFSPALATPPQRATVQK